MQTKNKVKIAIIGVGSISNCHIQAYKKDSRAEIVAFCDINKTTLKNQGMQYGVEKLYTNADEMFKEVPEIDAVSICTWNNTHKELSIKALRAGKDVLCEKPMAISYIEACEMQKVAFECGRKLIIGFVRRHGSDCEVARDLIKAGKLGNIYYAKACYLRRNGNPGGWFANKSLSGGGPVIDLGVHVVDLVRYLSGNPKVVSVSAKSFNKLGNRPNIKDSKAFAFNVFNGETADLCDVEDMAVAIITFDNGLTLNLETSFSLNVQKDESYIQLFGDKGGLKLDNEMVLSCEVDGYLCDSAISSNKAQFDFYGAFDAEIKQFLDVVCGADAIAPAEDGVEIMRIIDAIYASAKQNCEIKL